MSVSKTRIRRNLVWLNLGWSAVNALMFFTDDERHTRHLITFAFFMVFFAWRASVRVKQLY